jgi:hypothetical protein
MKYCYCSVDFCFNPVREYNKNKQKYIKTEDNMYDDTKLKLILWQMTM